MVSTVAVRSDLFAVVRLNYNDERPLELKLQT
jgi:hypothetical protein